MERGGEYDAFTPETSTNLYQTTWRYIQEQRHFIRGRKMSWHILRHDTSINMEGQRKIMTPVSHDNRSLGRELNPRPLSIISSSINYLSMTFGY